MNSYELADALSLINSECSEEQKILIACVNKLRELADELRLAEIAL
jgi:hypothetical protein